jgi:hypothetical protein
MKLRISVSVAFVMFLIFALFPSVLAAQGVDPPHCCNAPAGIPGTAGMQSSIFITDAALASMGVSRTQFVDRLISVLMPARQVSLVYSTTTSLNPAAAAAMSADGQVPETVTVTQQYRVPREMIVQETIESMDELSITDGIVSLAISFRHTETTVPMP